MGPRRFGDRDGDGALTLFGYLSSFLEFGLHRGDGLVVAAELARYLAVGSGLALSVSAMAARRWARGEAPARAALDGPATVPISNAVRIP
ncbi:hypothetical protein [Mycobacterium sp.]|uniref:hypothetical protein n=1 Tax=Mycobacterium sp. TaxID=1785 RepID=UPI002D5833BB|nr:hypothetical protein [Mycobacterium sp.]HZA09080.1 hypothetical protein [Mycobacterium sp.]